MVFLHQTYSFIPTRDFCLSDGRPCLLYRQPAPTEWADLDWHYIERLGIWAAG